MKRINYFILAILVIFLSCKTENKKETSPKSEFTPGKIWLDTDGRLINAHGGGILYQDGKYYWYGEHKGENSNSALVGVTCYSSPDLYNWTFESVALPVSLEKGSPIEKGCIMERPKVIYNEKTKKYVMFFHLELKGKGYGAAQVGIATADKPQGPFTLISNQRVNAEKWPMNLSQEQINSKGDLSQEWWTPEWHKAVEDGLYVKRDFKDGQMSRDMTLYVDDDKKAYHVYSSEENLTIQVAELNDDYTGYTGRYIRIDPAGHNEAPAILKKDGKYYMITSGCTGWAPNAARLLEADSIMGKWTRLDNPCIGKDANLTFQSQSTYILPIQGKKDQFIFLADRWKPENPIDGRYVWLPVVFENGLPRLYWQNKWDLDIFDSLEPSKETTTPDIKGYTLVWSDEFNNDGPLGDDWSYETGFVRNNEDQWYQAENASVKNGVLNIEAKIENVDNPNYDSKSKDWRKNRAKAKYTSALVKTQNKINFKNGRIEVRAKIPNSKGAWPAIWTLGESMEWPSCGEIDIMEYYQIDDKPHILANFAWGTDKQYVANWKSKTMPFKDFLKKDPMWAQKFHVWRMDWDDEKISLYIDDMLVNEIQMKDVKNGKLGNGKNPFDQPHYLLLNLAIGGDNGGTPDDSAFPLQYEIDYVRIYLKDQK